MEYIDETNRLATGMAVDIVNSLAYKYNLSYEMIFGYIESSDKHGDILDDNEFLFMCMHYEDDLDELLDVLSGEIRKKYEVSV